ncbi:adenosine deaminase [Bradyrhizobium japonicum]
MLVDLHVHLRGTLIRETVLSLAERNGIDFPDVARLAGRCGWHDFESFLRAYDLVTSVVRSAADLEEVACSYLHRCAAIGGAYVEFMLSPPDLARTGVPFHDQLRSLQSAAERAVEQWGIHSSLIATAVRHLGPEAAVQAARMATSVRADILVGFGLTGNENVHSASEFTEAFHIARSEGLRATAHAGEHRPAETIIEAIDALGLDRVGHGVRAIESPDVTRQLADAQIPLEICLGSNLALGLYPSVAKHPIRSLTDAGCAIVLGTDDPGFFNTDLRLEYERAEHMGPPLTRDTISATAIEAAFCDHETKARLRARLQDRTIPAV